jgi:acyl-CoA thioesterase YciA
MDEIVFKQPVFVGDLVSLFVDIERVGKTSITVTVSVWAQRAADRSMQVRVTEACVTMVAVDAELNPTPVLRKP